MNPIDAKTLRTCAFMAVGLALVMSREARAQTYNSITGFSATQGLNQWSYLDGNLNPMIWDSTRYGGAWRYNDGSTGDWCYIGPTKQHPGTASYSIDSIRRWTAPSSGIITISGSSKTTGAYGGDGAYVSVRKNGANLAAPQLVPPSDTLVGKYWYFTTYVVPGDTIDLVLNKYSNYTGDEQFVTQTITYVSGYNSILGFSSTQGANQWSYHDSSGWGMQYGSAYGPSWFSNTPPGSYGDWCYISSTQQHPGNNTSANDSIRRWTAPSAGNITIRGSSKASAGWGGDGVNVYVRKNGSNIYAGYVNGGDFVIGTSWNLNATVAAGDTIDTVVNRNGTYSGDEQVLTQQISYVQFSPVSCNACGTGWDRVSWRYNMGGQTNHYPPYVTDDSNIPNDLNFNCGSNYCHYINWVKNTRAFIANQYVHGVTLNVTALKTEVGYDWVDWSIPPTAVPGPATLTGYYTPFNWYLYSAANQSFQSNPGRLTFNSDGSVSDTGIKVDGALVCCGAAVSTIPTINAFSRTTGVLLGRNDTVYFNLQASANYNIHSSIALQGEPGAEFDLYMKCNGTPTPTNSTKSSYTVGSQEFMHIVDTTDCPSGGTMTFAVNSTSGPGWFNIIPAQHFAGTHRTLRIGTSYNANGSGANPTMAYIGEQAALAAAQWYGATEGTNWIDQIDVFNTTDCLTHVGNNCGSDYCDICQSQIGGTSSLTGPDGYNPGKWRTTMVQNWTFYNMTHEFGHLLWHWTGGMDIQDEYSNGGITSHCGHSIMAWAGTENTNFCWVVTPGVLEDHLKDGSPGASGGPNSPWHNAYGAGVVPWKPYETPDNYDYVNHPSGTLYLPFDFKGLYGRVVVH